MADVTERTLALLSSLQTGRAFGAEELGARLGVSTRTVRRDVDRLRGYGYPVHSQPGPGGSYRLGPGRTLPPLVLDDDEAVATLIGLALLAAASSDDPEALGNAATRAYGKIDQFLPTRLRPQAAALRASIEAHQQRTPAIAAATIAALGVAIADREVVRFDYRDQHDTPSERRVEPHRQVHLGMRWYLLAWDLERDDWRAFRLDRVDRVLRTTRRFEPRRLPARSAVDYLREGMNVERHQVRVTIDAPPTKVADALKYHDCEIEPTADRATRVTVAVDAWEWLLPHLARLDAEFTFGEPVTSSDEIRRFARRLHDAVGRRSAPRASSSHDHR